jgi:hypothetical protein
VQECLDTGHFCFTAEIVKLNSSGAEQWRNTPHLTSAYNCAPSAAALNPISGLLFVTTTCGGTVYEYSQNGTIVGYSACDGCNALLADDEGNLFALADSTLLVFNSTMQLLGNATLAGMPIFDDFAQEYYVEHEGMAMDASSAELYVLQHSYATAGTVPYIAVFPSPLSLLLPPVPQSSSSSSSPAAVSSSLLPSSSFSPSSPSFSSSVPSTLTSSSSSFSALSTLTSSSPNLRVSQASTVRQPLDICVMTLLLVLLLHA